MTSSPPGQVSWANDSIGSPLGAGNGWFRMLSWPTAATEWRVSPWVYWEMMPRVLAIFLVSVAWTMRNSWVNWGVDWLGSLEERIVSCIVGGRVVDNCWRSGGM